MTETTTPTGATVTEATPGGATGSETSLDEQRLAAFEERMVDVVNHGALTLMLSVGHRTRLFDTMAELGTARPAEIARHADLSQRYVTEWLGAMTVGRVVDHDPAAGTYTLPPEHARLLTRTRSDENIAAFAQYIPLLGAVEDPIIDCFRNGGGLEYAAFPRFHEIMEEDSGQTVLPALHDHILPLVPDLPERLARGIHVIDVGCGRGRALNAMAGWYPHSTFAGYDISEDAVAYAWQTAADAGLDNVAFHVADAARLSEVVARGSAGLVVTFDSVHDQVDPEAAVRGIRHAVADDGAYLAQDIDATSSHHGDRDHPLGPLLYTLSCMHCMTVSLAGGGAGLGAMWGRERARELFTAAGFTSVEVHNLEHDVQNAYYVCRP